MDTLLDRGVGDLTKRNEAAVRRGNVGVSVSGSSGHESLVGRSPLG